MSSSSYYLSEGSGTGVQFPFEILRVLPSEKKIGLPPKKNPEYADACRSRVRSPPGFPSGLACPRGPSTEAMP